MIVCIYCIVPCEKRCIISQSTEQFEWPLKIFYYFSYVFILIFCLFFSLCFQFIVFILDSLSLGVPLDESSMNGYSRCSMYAVNFTQMLADGVKKADPKWPTQPCTSGWEFDKDELPYSTISTEVNLNFNFG